MDVDELTRIAKEEDERRWRLGIDNHMLGQIARESKLFESVRGIVGYPIEDLRARITD